MVFKIRWKEHLDSYLEDHRTDHNWLVTPVGKFVVCVLLLLFLLLVVVVAAAKQVGSSISYE